MCGSPAHCDRSTWGISYRPATKFAFMGYPGVMELVRERLNLLHYRDFARDYDHPSPMSCRWAHIVVNALPSAMDEGPSNFLQPRRVAAPDEHKILSLPAHPIVGIELHVNHWHLCPPFRHDLCLHLFNDHRPYSLEMFAWLASAIRSSRTGAP